MITVIIVNYLCADLTLQAVESVLNEDQDLEIFVIDNSVDSDQALQLKQKLPEGIILIINETNEGFAIACNRAYHLSHGELILLLNPDAYLLPGCLSILKQELLKHPKVGAVGPQVFWDKENNFYLPPSLFPSPWSLLCNELSRLQPFWAKLYSFSFRKQALRVWTSHKDYLNSKALSGGHVLLKRSAIEDCGGLFDERYFMYYEDTDLMLRLKRANFRLYAIPKAKCVHQYEHNPSKVQLMETSASKYFDKNHKNSLIFKFIKWLSKLNSSTSSFYAFENLGTIESSLQLNVPDTLRSNWLLEVSPSPLFIPAIGLFGKGNVAEISASCFQRLHSGIYFCRISNTGSIPIHIKQWRLEKI